MNTNPSDELMAGNKGSPGTSIDKDSQPHHADLSPAITTVAFDPVVPLLRVPIPAGEDDDPSKGPYVLAFGDEETWRCEWHNCERKISEQCMAGARIGCSVNASQKCMPPWWHNLFPFFSSSKCNKIDKEACEEREMEACLVAAKERCSEFAKETCKPVFTEVRIADTTQPVDPRFTSRKYRLAKKWTNKDDAKTVQTHPFLNPASKEQCSGLETSDPDTTSMRTCLKKTNIQANVLLDGELFQGPYEGPVWVDGDAYGDLVDKVESDAEGWEGGLVRPKMNAKKQT